MIPTKAFILAAGFGKRLRPHTSDRPKPMVDVAGKSLINRTIDHLRTAGINTLSVNTHYLAETLEDHLLSSGHDDIELSLSHEPDILDTGGGIKNCLHHFNGEDFFVLSGDGLWSDGPSGNALENLSNAWDPAKMDILMLLQPVDSMKITHGVGDYDLDANGRAIRSKTQDGKYMFTSIRINRAGIFEDAPDRAFSYLQLMDQAQENGRLYGLVHDGDWHHISTPDDLQAVRMLYDKEDKHARSA